MKKNLVSDRQNSDFLTRSHKGKDDRKLSLKRSINIAWTISIIVIVTVSSGWAVTNNAAKVRLSLGAAESGSYYQFAQDMADVLQKHAASSVEIVHITTQGSVDNLQRLKDRSLDMAIVQNDIAYYTYKGKYGHQTFKGFSTAVPLFPEYVQVIVSKGSDIRILGDLRNRVIALGPLKSGSLRNGLDLLREIGLRPDVDFKQRNMPTTDSVRDLLSGKIDVMIYTGAALPMKNPTEWKDIRILPIPSEVIRELTNKFTYYKRGEFTNPTNSEQKGTPTLTVTAYLMMGNHVSEASAHAVTEALVQAWPNLSARRTHYQLITLGEGLRRLPVPLHPGAKTVFHEVGLIKTGITEYVVVLTAVLMLLLVWWARNQCVLYDRLGNVRAADTTWYYRIVLWINRSGAFFLILIVLSIVLVGIVELIQYFEAEHAREMNVDNEFADIDFWDAMLWMIMFMGSGHVSGIFPLSILGKVLAAVVPFLGFSTLFALFWAGVNRHMETSAARKRGTLIKHLKDHILVCGWNEKVPGLIFALTSADAPSKKQVVVVAELEGDMPLEKYKFDPKYVSYSRGDSADHKTLENSYVEDASAAVVVAGIRKRKGHNLRSVLSVLALKATHGAKADKKSPHNEHLFTAAEILFDDNEELFSACQTDALVHSDTIANRLAAQCCISEHVVDFVLDMLTYDKYSELNSVSASRLQEASLADGLMGSIKQCEWKKAARALLAWISTNSRHGLIGLPLGEIRNLLALEGINVVGMLATDSLQTGGKIDHHLDVSAAYQKLLCDGDKKNIFSKKHALLFIADDESDIYVANWRVSSCNRDGEKSGGRPQFVIPTPEEKKVLLVGDYRRCKKVRKLLRPVSKVDASILTDSKGISKQRRGKVVVVEDYSTEKVWEKANLAEMGVVIILNKATQPTDESDIMQDQGEVDAQVILTATLARQFFEKSNAKGHRGSLKVVAEMLGRNNQQLFHDAGVDVLIPSNLLVERMLTKLVYTRGQVTEFLMNLLALDNESHFLTVRLSETRHKHLLEKTFQQLMQEMPTGFQFLGVLPDKSNYREKLENKQKDFSYHFLASPRLAEQMDYQSQPGDIIALIVSRAL